MQHDFVRAWPTVTSLCEFIQFVLEELDKKWLDKLYQYGLSHEFTNLVKFIEIGRRQYVERDDCVSDTCESANGVAQGWNLE